MGRGFGRPLLTIGAYYLGARTFALTQVEIAHRIPLLAAWWFAQDADPGHEAGQATPGRRRPVRRRRRAVQARLRRDRSVLLDPRACFGCERGCGNKERNPPQCGGRPRLAWRGLAIPLMLTASYFAAYGQLGRIWWTYFTYSPTLCASSHETSAISSSESETSPLRFCLSCFSRIRRHSQGCGSEPIR